MISHRLELSVSSGRVWMDLGVPSTITASFGQFVCGLLFGWYCCRRLATPFAFAAFLGFCCLSCDAPGEGTFMLCKCLVKFGVVALLELLVRLGSVILKVL